MATPISDTQLIERLRQDDATAFEEFVRAQTPRALATARRFLRNESDAQDAVQDAFLSFFKSLPTFREQSQLSTWFYRIVVNAAMMKRRSQSRRSEAQIDDLLPRFYPDGHRIDPRPAWSDATERIVENDETRRIVRETIDQLPEDYRNVVLLRDIEQWDTAQTAALLGETEGAVKVRLHRARQALRTLLERRLASWDEI